MSGKPKIGNCLVEKFTTKRSFSHFYTQTLLGENNHHGSQSIRPQTLNDE